MRELLAMPFTDVYRGVQRATEALGLRALPLLIAACAAGWWVYVPVHELMHGWGAQLGGATVTRLDIDPWYGARLLQRVFPYVHPGSAYAGQLAGFDTHGSDLAYVLAVIFPFALTVVVGIPVLVRALRATPSVTSTLLLGLVLPVAWAPILSIGGDYYELGAIAISRIAATFGVDGGSWRGDDVFAVLGRVSNAGDAIGVSASLLLGAVLALATYAGARLAAARFASAPPAAL